jgi:uncharacterized membrane protein
MTSKKKSPNFNNTREAKKALVMNTGNKNPTPIVNAAAVVITVAAGLGLLLFPGNEPSPIPTAGAAPVTAANDGRFTYAVSLFDDGQVRHFDFTDAGSNATIKYFILKSADGVIRAAFDACDVCWPEGKGYVQDGTAMVCRNCGRRFESVMVNEVEGGCNPAPLKRTLQGDQVVIRTDDLMKGQAYFNFSKKA